MKRRKPAYRPRADWAPYHVIAWRMLWWIPMLVTKSFFLAVVAIGWGPSVALRVNRSL